MAVRATEKIATASIASGIVGGAFSYFLLDRKSATTIFGKQVSEYQADAILIAVSSALGDIGGAYILPFIESKISGNATLNRMVSTAAVPMITGGVHVAGKKLLTTKNSNSIVTELLLAGGTKIAVEYVGKSMLPNLF
jgi:hypothetical protein